MRKMRLPRLDKPNIHALAAGMLDMIAEYIQAGQYEQAFILACNAHGLVQLGHALGCPDARCKSAAERLGLLLNNPKGRRAIVRESRRAFKRLTTGLRMVAKQYPEAKTMITEVCADFGPIGV